MRSPIYAMLKGSVSVCLVGVPAVSSLFIKLWRHAGKLNAATDAVQVAYVLNDAGHTSLSKALVQIP